MKKEKVKPVEEVIDVVGDFGPIPPKHEEVRYADENFGEAFDVGGVQTDSQSQLPPMMHDQAMMPPHLGKLWGV